MTTVYVRPDGPYVVTGDFELDARGAPRDDSSVVLCRCGRSLNKPYCDGMHTRVGFVDAGVLSTTIAEPGGAIGAGRLTMTPKPNGPLKCSGALKISDANGRTREIRDVFLCRCGGSATKPFCDGTHAKIGFVS